MRYEGRASWWRVFGTLVLGHFAAALSFSVSAVVGSLLIDSTVSMMSVRGIVTDLPGNLLLLVVLTPIAMLPASLLTSPFTILAALKFRAGAGTALTVGAAIGAAWVLGMFKSEISSATWSRAGFPGDPRTLAAIVGDGAIAGMAYAWVVWSRCIRPYRNREGALRSSLV